MGARDLCLSLTFDWRSTAVTTVIMILLEVGSDLVANLPCRSLILNTTFIAPERCYPNHPGGEMHQVRFSRLFLERRHPAAPNHSDFFS